MTVLQVTGRLENNRKIALVYDTVLPNGLHVSATMSRSAWEPVRGALLQY